MSEDPSPKPDEPQNKAGKGVMIALLAGILGLAAGAGLYALSGSNDNIAGDAKTVAGTAEAGACVLDETLRAKLDQAAGGDVAAFKAIDRAYSVAALPFKDSDGTAKTLGDWKGKTVLFNLWATWCGPCRAEMPALDALQKELGGDNFEVVPVSVDLGDDAKPKKFFADIAIKDMRFFHDGELATLNSLKKDGLAFGLPATLLVSQDGCILVTLNGPAEWASDDAKRLIKTAMSK